MYVPYTLHEYYDELEKEFHQLHLDFQETLGGETLHQLRVNIKKHLAFFRLLHGLGGKLSLEEIQKPFIKFTRKIGKIRNLEILQQLLKTEEIAFSVTNGYSAKIEKDIAKKRKQLKKPSKDISLIPFKEVSDKVRRNIDHIPLGNVQENLGEYFHFLLEEIRQTIHQEVSIEQLHSLRKVLKTLFFNLRLTDRMIPKEDFSKKLYDKLVGFSKQFGDWHDEFITIEKLRNNPKKVNKKVFKDLKNKERQSRQELRKQFKNIFKLTKKIEKEIYRLFAEDEEVMPLSRRFEKEKYHRIWESFEQVNIGESLK